MKLYMGTAGWSYPDWNGIVYPARRPRNFQELTWVAGLFNVVEVNSSFYRIPTPAMCKSWLDKVEAFPDFLFLLKLYQGFSHHNLDPDGIEGQAFKAALAPMQKRKRLGPLLLQFPYSFQRAARSERKISKIVQSFSEFQVAVEFRHSSWNQEEIYAELAGKGAFAVNIDQPVIGDSIKLESRLTSGSAYFRYHGRNYRNWFAKDASRDSRYDYLYNQTELDEIHKAIKLIKAPDRVFAIFNNHFRGLDLPGIA